jgi:hypothetical protein
MPSIDNGGQKIRRGFAKSPPESFVCFLFRLLQHLERVAAQIVTRHVAVKRAAGFHDDP